MSHRRKSEPVVPAPAPLADDAAQRWLVPATLAILAVALVRAVVAIYPDIYWGVDPRHDESIRSLTGIGAAGTAWLSVLGVAAAAAGLAAHVRARGRIDWLSTGLAAAGAGACAWHVALRADNGLECGSWISGVMMGLAMLHLCNHARPRVWAAAALAAMIFPLAINAVLYVLIGHPDTVAYYLKHKAEILAQNGWTDGSPQQLLYERRLNYREVGGAFGLSNVNGSIIGAMTLAALGLAVGPIRRMRPWRTALPLGLAAIGAAAVVLTQSKGAAAALVVCAGLLLAARWASGRPWARPLIGPAAVLLPMLAVAVVLARGAIGPSTSGKGELSLLVRSQYWHAAGRMFEHQPLAEKLLGVGPARFKDVYTRWKDPLNPEEVVSSHNLEIDDFVMLGLGGAAWVAMTLMWLWRAGRGAATPPPPKTPESPDELSAGARWQINDRVAMGALLLAAGIFGTQFIFEGDGLLTPESFVGWTAGVIGFIVLTAALVSSKRSDAGPAAGLMAGAALLVLHNQIEMTFFSASAAGIAYLFMGAAAGAATGASNSGSSEASAGGAEGIRWLAPAALAAGAVALAVGYAAPVTRQQAALEKAALALHDKNSPDAIVDLESAMRIMPTDPGPYAWYAQLMTEAAMAWASRHEDENARELFTLALGRLDSAHAAGLDDLTLLRTRAQVLEHWATVLRDRDRLEGAIRTWRRVLERAPQSVEDCTHLADLLWSIDQRADARELYRRCLEINDNTFLDPLRQMSKEEKARLTARLGGMSASGPVTP